MNILLTGASGFLGRHISKALQDAGHLVKAVSRRDGFDFKQMTTKEAWLPHLKEIDVVINCVGIIVETANQTFTTLHYQAPLALFHACLESNDITVVQISALGANDNAFTPYQLSKKAADDALRSLPLKWFVLRPSLVYGRGGKSMEMFQRLASLPVLPLIDGGNQKIQPVHINDLTEAVLACLTSSKSKRTLDIVGAHSVLLKEWLQLMRAARGKTPAVIIPIPYKLSLTIAIFGKYIFPLMHPDNLRMLNKGSYADVNLMAEFIGHLPLDIKTGWGKI
ncbi:MAG: complex I NDUFA9 subunit family protein [Gammaproteobacteria bacterium]|nr:complex I NDUFA9 subunit family protein [Gammaproteobacteria bacterium]